jgi:hypothetical protein
MRNLVGLPGFEPGTSCTPSKRSRSVTKRTVGRGSFLRPGGPTSSRPSAVSSRGLCWSTALRAWREWKSRPGVFRRLRLSEINSWIGPYCFVTQFGSPRLNVNSRPKNPRTSAQPFVPRLYRCSFASPINGIDSANRRPRSGDATAHVGTRARVLSVVRTG